MWGPTPSPQFGNPMFVRKKWFILHICSIALICLAAPQQWELQQHPFPAKHCASMPPGGNPLFADVLSWHIFLYISQLAPGMENCNSNSTQLKREDNNSQNRWISANDPWPACYKEVTSTTKYIQLYIKDQCDCGHHKWLDLTLIFFNICAKQALAESSFNDS